MKKKIVILIIVILILLAVASASIIFIKTANNGASKLENVYNQMIENQTYSFTRYDFEEQHKLITHRKNGKTLIDMYNPGQHLSTLVVDKDTYLIYHENKEYYVYTNNSVDEEILIDDLKKIIETECTKGTEKIYGKKYKYEEYEGVSNFLISSPKNMDNSSVKTRFYFDKNELVYLKTIYDVINEETGERTQAEELQTVKVEYEVEDSIFEIPADYAENS